MCAFGWGGFVRDSREFLTANPTPSNLGSSGSFPCYKKVWSCSPRLPSDGSLVSCSAAMSILNLLRSKVFPLSFKHVMKQADCGESAPYWFEAVERSFSPSEATHRAWTYTSRSGLMTRNCCLLCWGDWDAQSSGSPSRPH